MEAYKNLSMIKYKILKEDFENSLFQNSDKLTVVSSLSEINFNDPAIMGGDILREEVRTRLTKKSPTIYIHRGYLGNHLYKQRKWWRWSVNNFANIQMHRIPFSRWNLLNLPKHPWKVNEVKRVLIAPSKMTSKIWTPEFANNWADTMVEKFPGAEIKIRFKGSKPGIRWSTLWDDLDWADLVVSQASAITAEAFWYGKKVISTHPCITWASEKFTLDDWKNPKEPENREEWLEHLAWSQFSNEEWKSGEAIELIEQYIGPVCNYNPAYTYNFIKIT